MLLALLERLALRRRRAGAHPVWTAVAFAALLLRRYQRRAAGEAVVLRQELQPGESLLISPTENTHG
jgi:hypothetical protein